MDNEREQEVQGEKSEAVGYPVQEIGGERPRPWSGPSHSCPEPADALATDDEEMTKADTQDEDLTVVETTKETEEVEAGGTEGEAEETVAEAEETVAEAQEAEAEETEGEAEETEAEEVESGVQEAPENSQSEPGSQPSPLGGTEVLQTEVLLPSPPTHGTAGQEKVSSRKRRNAKPGDPANTQHTPPPFHLQDFSFKIATRYYMALLFLLLVSTVNSNPIPARKCALCLHPECATRRLKICIRDDCTWLDRIVKGRDEFIWMNGTLEIKNCSKDSLKPDEPCQLMNGSLVVQSDQDITFEGMKAIPSETVSCAGLDLPPGPKFTPAPLVNTTANTTTPDTGPYLAAIIGGIFGGVAIGVVIAVIVRKYGKRCCRRRDGTGPQNTAPTDGNAGNEKEKIPLQSDANGNVTQGPGNDGESAM